MTAAPLSSGPTSTTGERGTLARLAARRGVRTAPFGTVVGALLGLIAGGAEDAAMSSSESALVMAALIGFALAPATVAGISVARYLRAAGSGGASSWAASIGYAAIVGAAWGAIGALVTYTAGSLVDLNLSLGGLVMTVIGAGTAIGAFTGLLVKLASLTARGGSAPTKRAG